MTELFLKNGIPSVKWTDSKGAQYSCSEKTYMKNFRKSDHDLEQKVDKLQNKEKRVDDIASTDETLEEKEKRLKQLESEIDPDEDLDKTIESLRAELASLQKAKKARSGNREFLGADRDKVKETYSVLIYNDQSVTHEGDSLMLSLGSTQ